MEELHEYCDSLKYELYYDVIGTIIPLIFGCLIIVPLADIQGRSRTLAYACHCVYVATFSKFLFLFYTRQTIGEGIANFAYPALKYTTQATVIELTGSSLRPSAFVLTSVGMYIPSTFAYFANLFSHGYWRHTFFIACAPVLLLPLWQWYMPESPMWLFSKKKIMASQFASETLTCSTLHNDGLLISLRNKKICWKDYKEFLKELKKLHILEFISVNILSMTVGMLWFYPYSRHKLQFPNFKNGKIQILYALGGLFSTLITLPFVYCMKIVKFSLAAIFLLEGVLLAVLINCSITEESVELLIFFIEIVSMVLITLYEFYLQEIFPTSHRCTCTAVCGVSSAIGLASLICWRELHSAYAGDVLSAVASLFSCIVSIFLIKNLKQSKSLQLNFEDTENVN